MEKLVCNYNYYKCKQSHWREAACIHKLSSDHMINIMLYIALQIILFTNLCCTKRFPGKRASIRNALKCCRNFTEMLSAILYGVSWFWMPYGTSNNILGPFQLKNAGFRWVKMLFRHEAKKGMGPFYDPKTLNYTFFVKLISLPS